MITVSRDEITREMVVADLETSQCQNDLYQVGLQGFTEHDGKGVRTTDVVLCSQTLVCDTAFNMQEFMDTMFEERLSRRWPDDYKDYPVITVVTGWYPFTETMMEYA